MVRGSVAVRTWLRCVRFVPVKPDSIRELERAARLGLSGAMITEYPVEDRRYDQPEYERFWAAAAALDMPLSLHTATRRQGSPSPTSYCRRR